MIEDADILELKGRYDFLMRSYVKNSLELASMLEKFGKQRKELQLLYAEFVRRGEEVQDPEDQKEAILEELNGSQ